MNMGGGHDMSQMEGTLSEKDLQQLSDAPRPEATELFLNQMIAHHEGAVAMADDEVANGTFQPAIDLAQTIITTQRQETDTMQQMLEAMKAHIPGGVTVWRKNVNDDDWQQGPVVGEVEAIFAAGQDAA